MTFSFPTHQLTVPYTFQVSRGLCIYLHRWHYLSPHISLPYIIHSRWLEGYVDIFIKDILFPHTSAYRTLYSPGVWRTTVYVDISHLHHQHYLSPHISLSVHSTFQVSMYIIIFTLTSPFHTHQLTVHYTSQVFRGLCRYLHYWHYLFTYCTLYIPGV